MSFTLGLTGGIASGKSLVGQYFSELGIPVIDADQVSRDVVAPGAAGLQAIVEYFGTEILNSLGEMDRPQMRKRVFSDPAARLQLEAILHPHMRRRLLDLRDQAFSLENTSYCILMIPLLVKFGWADLVDRLLVVDCHEDTQRSRLLARDGIDETLAANMINSQDSRAERLAAADDIILNESSADALREPVIELNTLYQQLADGTIGQLPPQNR